MRFRLLCFANALACVVAGSSPAQVPVAGKDPDAFQYRPDRQVVVFEEGHFLTQEGSWGESTALRQYAASHPTLGGGTFAVFQDGKGPLRTLTDRKILRQLQATYAPMKALTLQQEALAREQRPLAEQQRALALQMKAATTPAAMAAVGSEQAHVGQLQGAIGHQQGLIGQQQGAIGRSFYAQLQNALDLCLREGTCPVAAPPTAAQR